MGEKHHSQWTTAFKEAADAAAKYGMKKKKQQQITEKKKKARQRNVKQGEFEIPHMVKASWDRGNR